jgi:arylsulfatase A-like enzyme
VDSVRSGLLGAAHGFDRGFDTYAHGPHTPDPLYLFDMAATVDAALAWVTDRPGDKPFFLFLHTKSVHGISFDSESLSPSDSPYWKPQPYQGLFLPDGKERFVWRKDEETRAINYLRWLNKRLAKGEMNREDFSEDQLYELVALYDAGIVYTDQQIGRLLESLKEMGLKDNTLIVLTADHGEAFLDHHLFLHKEMYRPLLRVPLIWHDPRRPAGRVVAEEVILEDIMPTLLEAAGASVPTGLIGRTLPLDGSARPKRKHFSYFHYSQRHFYESLALRNWPWKLICHKFKENEEYTVELYNLSEDLDESRLLSGEEERKRAMQNELFRWYQKGMQRKRQGISITPEEMKHLHNLGYGK